MEEEARAADELTPKAARPLLNEMWQEAWDRGHGCSFRVISGSMRPLIEVGDLVRVTGVEPSRVGIGDVVALQQGENVVVHRIIGKRRSNQQLLFRHRGDAGGFSGIAPAQDLIGKACAIERGGREISLDTPWYAMSSKLLGWRLCLEDALRRAKHKLIGRRPG